MTRSSDPTDPFVQRVLTEPQPECHQPPSLIDTADLGREPEVVLRCGGLLAGRAFTAQRIYDALPKGLQAEAMYKTPLDLLSETQLQPDVIALAALLVKPGGQPTQTMIALCNELKVNAEPAVGMLELFHLTPPHQHAMGGLNMAGRQVVKTWWFCPPSSYGPSLGSGRSVRPSESDRASAIRLEQFEGDVIWIPPGWWHSVFTRCGDTISHNMQGWPDDEYAAHWVTWVLPEHMTLEALAQWGCSWVTERQSDEDYNGGVSKTKKQKVWEVFLVGL
jgi:hypothetical protein